MRAMKTTVLSMLALSAVALSSCSWDVDENVISGDDKDVSGEVQPVEKFTVEIVDIHPFDPTSFTQGLEMDGEELIVGTGLQGESEVYRRDVTTGERSVTAEYDEEFFGEGLTVHGDDLWTLTWTSGTAIMRDKDTLEETGRSSYPGQGWGLCSDQERLYLSDGTENIRIMNPGTFSQEDHLTVTLEDTPVDNLNELECVGDDIYANVWGENDIYRIDKNTGEVTGIVNASSLDVEDHEDPDNVLNGIAYREDTDTFFLSGKRWNDLYEVRFVPEA